jgi:uncharacterized protein (DUF488 family)
MEREPSKKPPADEAGLRPTIWTVGHGARRIEELVRILNDAGIRHVVDVRTAPGSRKHPHFGKDSLSATLDAAGIAYWWRKDLGGFRTAVDGSPHTALESRGFRGYADHMDTAEFDSALEWLMAQAREEPTAYLCAESLWWRCHRGMISDALLGRGWDVRHLMGDGRSELHQLHRSARLIGHRVRYDIEQPRQQQLQT